MKYFLVLVIAVVSAASTSAQTSNIIVEKVSIKETIEGKFTSEIPRLRDKTNPINPAVAAINTEILDVFMLESYNQSEITDFRWFDVKFESEVKDNIVFIAYTGEYMGAYPNYTKEELYFDLKTGKRMPNVDIEFQSLFTLQGYLDFLNRHWLPAAKDKFQQAMECAGGEEPYCSLYDISQYSLENNKLTMELSGDCYPHAIENCSPVFNKTLAIDSIKPFLSEIGMKILLQDRYTEKKGVEKMQYALKTNDKIPNYAFLFGLIDGKYAVSMALNFDESGGVSGYYYYDKRGQKIALKGVYKSASMDLEETVNGKTTGKFHFIWGEAYQENGFYLYAPGRLIYLKGMWSDPTATKNLAVKGKGIKITKPMFWVRK